MPRNRGLRCAAGLLGPGEGHVPSWGDLRALRPGAPCPGPTCLLGVVAEHWVEQEEQPGGQSTGVDGCKAASRPLSCLGGLGSRALATCLPSRCPPRPDSGAAVPSPGPGPTGAVLGAGASGLHWPWAAAPRGPLASQCPRSPAQVHRVGMWLGATQRSSENQHSGGDAGGVAEAIRQRPVSHVAEQVEEVQTVTLHPEGPGP